MISNEHATRQGPTARRWQRRRRAAVDRRWKPGQSGNPVGRPKNAGATKKEWLNTFSAQGLTGDDLRRIERDPKAPQAKRAAAQQMLHTLMPQMADYEDLVNGKKTVTELGAEGVDTSLIKKLKVREERDREGNIVAVTRELELHNVAGEAFDRICDRTDGKPTQAVSLDGSLGVPTVVEFNTPGTRALAQRGSAQ